MSDANRVRIALLRETTFGVLPGSARLRTLRMTGESLAYTPQFVSSNEIRSDRMNADPIKVNEQNAGGINFELSYPNDNGPLEELVASAMFNPWIKTNSRDNDGTADSVITDVASSGGVVTCTTGTAFVVGQLVRNTGFGQSANNGLFRCTTGSATVPAFASQGLVNEPAPAAAARMKVVGFQGASGDITATATGLASTALDFTTLGLQVGQRVRPSSNSGGGFGFATAALSSAWARITAIAANALTLDMLPAGWTTDAGSGKTIRVYVTDFVRNGTTRRSLAIERSFLDQAVPTHILQKGMVVGQLQMAWQTEQLIAGSFDLMGLTGSQGTVANGASYDAASTGRVMSANVSVGRICEAGVAIASPNYVRNLQFSINNNLRQLTAVGNVGAVDIGAGENAGSGTAETYFGSNAFLTKLLNGTPSSLTAEAAIDNQAFIVTFPRVTFTQGSPSAGQKNADVLLPLQFQSSIDTLTNCHQQFDRAEYFD